MSPTAPAASDSRRFRSTHRLWSALAILAIAGGTVLQLRIQGRPWWCSCERAFLWAGDVHSQHNSQHLFDPYSLTHVLHGVVLCGILAWSVPRVTLWWRFSLALFVEAVWEIVENSDRVIERYRAATIALGYQGDSIANSMGDILSCSVGFAIAWRLGLRGSLALFFATELLLLFWIRDSLLLNVVMLIYPLEAIKAWQLGS